MSINPTTKLSPEQIAELEDSLMQDPPVPVREDEIGDPVVKNAKGFWYYDETWSTIVGPFETEGLTRDALRKHLHWLETGKRLEDQS